MEVTSFFSHEENAPLELLMNMKYFITLSQNIKNPDQVGRFTIKFYLCTH